MVFQLFTPNKRIANLVFHDHVIRYIEIKPGKTPIVVKWGEKFIPEGIIHEGKILDKDTVVSILEECVSDWGIKKRQVSFTIPDPYVIIRKLQVPGDLTPDEIRGYLYLEIGTNIHLPFEDAAFDFDVLGKAGEKQEILLFASPETIVADYSEILMEAKLKPLAADISPLCLYRLFHRFDQVNRNDHYLLIQIDLQSVNVSIFHKDRPVFMRHIVQEGSLEQWNMERQPAVWKGTPEEFEYRLDSVFKELEHIMNFYRFSLTGGNEQITRVLLSGDCPFLPNFRKRFLDRYEMPVEMVLSENIQTQSGELLNPGHFLALGLALKEVQ